MGGESGRGSEEGKGGKIGRKWREDKIGDRQVERKGGEVGRGGGGEGKRI